MLSSTRWSRTSGRKLCEAVDAKAFESATNPFPDSIVGRAATDKDNLCGYLLPPHGVVPNPGNATRRFKGSHVDDVMKLSTLRLAWGVRVTVGTPPRS